MMDRREAGRAPAVRGAIFLVLLVFMSCKPRYEAPPAAPAPSAPPANEARAETLEDPPYALDSVFKPETHRATPIPLPPDVRLLGDVLIAEDGEANAHLGEAVAIDGDLVAAGAPYADVGRKTDAGAVYVFLRADGEWRASVELTAPTPVSYDRFGASVAISGDTLVAGADRHDGFTTDGGAAFVFTRAKDGTWAHTVTLAPRSLAPSATLGYSAALDGDTLVLGAPGAGTVHVFSRRGGTWREQAELRPPAALRYSGFGHSVRLDGEALVVGANTASDLLMLGGSAYVFRRQAGTWQLEAELRSPRDEALARFGTAVAIRGDVVLIGASRATVGESTRAGAAFVFERRGGAWVAVAELANDPPRSDEEFGRALALLPGAAVVGSHFGDAAGLNTGGAVLYTNESGDWRRSAVLLAEDRATISEFAYAIAASDREVVLGAPRRNTSVTAAGGVYVFQIRP